MEQKRRWLSLDPAGLLWGSERALLDFIGDVPGFEAGCCCPPGPLASKLKERGVVVFPYFQPNLHLRGRVAWLRGLFGLFYAICRFRPQVIHVNQAGATRMALVTGRLLRIPCVVHVRIAEDVLYLAGLSLKQNDLRQLIAISDPIATLLAAQPQLAGIPKCTLMDAYQPRYNAQQARAPSSMGRLKKDWDFVCIGRFSKSKGQELLVQASRILRNEGLQFSLLFIGELNAHGKEVQAQAHALMLDDIIKFTGHLDDVYPLLERSKWLVCPSQFEPLGRVLFEAWDTGVPVVAGSFSGGAAVSVRESSGGLLFAEWTAAALATTLQEAMKRLEASEEFAIKGRQWMHKATDPKQYTQSFAAVVSAAID